MVKVYIYPLEITFMGLDSYLILAYAVTPIHVGAGRSPGVVDLPFQRDSIGYPIIFGSSYKGVLKSYLQQNNKSLANCFFGSGPDVSTSDSSPEMGRFIVTDLVPVFYPVASLDEGYVYITTEYLLSRVEDLLSSLGCNTNPIYIEEASNTVKKIKILLEDVDVVKEVSFINKLKSPDKGQNLGALIREKGYALNNEVGLQAIEASLIRVTRNVLDDDTKTSKNIWTEEYVPHGTILVGGVIDAARQNKFCSEIAKNGDISKLFVDSFDNKAVFIGGKETVGKGLIKIKIIHCGNLGQEPNKYKGG
jgi:CRISPR-associated protein Cmr4